MSLTICNMYSEYKSWSKQPWRRRKIYCVKTMKKKLKNPVVWAQTVDKAYGKLVKGVKLTQQKKGSNQRSFDGASATQRTRRDVGMCWCPDVCKSCTATAVGYERLVVLVPVFSSNIALSSSSCGKKSWKNDHSCTTSYCFTTRDRPARGGR